MKSFNQIIICVTVSFAVFLFSVFSLAPAAWPMRCERLSIHMEMPYFVVSLRMDKIYIDVRAKQKSASNEILKNFLNLWQTEIGHFGREERGSLEGKHIDGKCCETTAPNVMYSNNSNSKRKLRFSSQIIRQAIKRSCKFWIWKKKKWKKYKPHSKPLASSFPLFFFFTARDLSAVFTLFHFMNNFFLSFTCFFLCTLSELQKKFDSSIYVIEQK